MSSVKEDERWGSVKEDEMSSVKEDERWGSVKEDER